MKFKLVLLFLFSLLLLSFKLATVPVGLTIDEASFGYNAVLLSRTLHDETGRFLPVFVLSINKTDWRQPVTQYFITAVFKLFEPSVFLLRFTSVIVASVSIVLIYFLGGILSSLLLLVTPVFFMHSHLALDNIMPVPFILVWLISIWNYSKNKNIKNLVLAGIAIGIGFYSYKGIRVFLPVWLITSSIYIYLLGKWKSVFIYLLSALPFFAIVPYLEVKYAGAVLNNEKIKFEGVYQFLYRYLSYFDLSFLFGQGDTMLIHSTGKHGMYLFMTLPLFLIGLVKSWKKDYFYRFITLSFFLGPLLFGFFGLIHRSSKLLSEVPFYIVLASFGALWLFKNKRHIFILICSLVLINFASFLYYYWFVYPSTTKDIFYSMTSGEEYRTLKEISDKYKLTPYVDSAKVSTNFSSGDFIRSIYFTKMPNGWSGDSKSLPDNSVVMTDNPDAKDLERLDYKFENYLYYRK